MSVLGMGVVGAGIMGRRMMAALQQHPRWRVAAAWDPHTDTVPDATADEALAVVRSIEALSAG